MNRYILKESWGYFTYNRKLRGSEIMYIVDDPDVLLHENKQLYRWDPVTQDPCNPSHMKVFIFVDDCVNYCVDTWYDKIYEKNHAYHTYWTKTRFQSREELRQLLLRKGSKRIEFPVDYCDLEGVWKRMASRVTIHRIEKILYT
jgi:hypothetical protein